MIRQDAVDSLQDQRHIETYSDTCQASRIECFKKIFTLPIFEKSLGSIYARVVNIPRF